MLSIDGIVYDVDFCNFSESMKMENKYSKITADKVKKTKVNRVVNSYTFTIGDIDDDTYVSIKSALCSKDDYHTFILLNTKNRPISFEGLVISFGAALIIDKDDGTRLWDNLTIGIEDRQDVS